MCRWTVTQTLMKIRQTFLQIEFYFLWQFTNGSVTTNWQSKKKNDLT